MSGSEGTKMAMDMAFPMAWQQLGLNLLVTSIDCYSRDPGTPATIVSAEYWQH
jgi:hypothetical protein